METLGEYLKRIRTEQKKTGLRDLSRRVGISHSYLSQIENGHKKNPAPYILKVLADELSIDYNILIDKAGYIEHKKYEKSYIKEERFNLEVPNQLNHRLDLASILSQEQQTFVFNQISLSKEEVLFIYRLLGKMTEFRRPVNKKHLNEMLEFVETLLKKEAGINPSQ